MRSPWGRTAWLVAGSGRGPGLTVTEVEGCHVPRSLWPAAGVVSGGWMTNRLDMAMLMTVWKGLCWVAASVVAAAAGGRGAQAVVGRGSSFELVFGLRFGLGRCRWGCRRCFCGVEGCVGWCWWWCCCCSCDCFGAGLGLGSGFGLGSGLRLRTTSVRFAVCCRDASVASVGVGEPPVPWCAAAALALAVALWMRSFGRGGSEDEVEDIDEDEDEEEVVVVGDAGCAVMRAVAGFWAVASAAATAGRMEGMSSGCKFGRGGFGGPAVTWRPGGPIWSAAVGEGGPGLRSSPSGLGWAWVPQCVRLCGLASARGNSSRGLHSEAGGFALGFLGCVQGACAGHWAGWACRGAWGSFGWVCAGCRVWRMVRGVRRMGSWRAFVVNWAAEGGPCRGARGPGQ